MELSDLCGVIYGVDPAFDGASDEEYTTYCDLAEGYEGPHSHAGQILWNDEDTNVEAPE